MRERAHGNRLAALLASQLRALQERNVPPAPLMLQSALHEQLTGPRMDLVTQVRARVQAGDYDDPAVIDALLDRLIEDLI